ncbi:MAG: heat-shock protein Hsp90 [Selenomonadaceae bacterium]|nr:heat-shock protein Hsp90 [Selenomonadaceae bacterium]
MTKEQLNEKIKSMAAAPSCCAELKAAVKAYLDAAGTSGEKSAAKNLLAEIEEDITTVDNLVPFAHSETAVQIFGAEGAKKFAAHADELKASGAKYCDCGACAPAVEILANKAVLLA